MQTITVLSSVCIALLAIKALFIGSDFSFHDWYKYGKRYTSWYSKRPTWKDVITKEKEGN